MPRNVTAFEINSTSLSISWLTPGDPNGIILRYNVSLYRQESTQRVLIETISVDAIPGQDSYSIVFDNLIAFTLYSVQVSAATSVGEGISSAPMFVTTDPDRPSRPSFVLAEVLNSTAVRLSWGYPDTPRGNITGYIIRHNTTNNEFTEFNLTTNNDMQNQTFLFTGLLPFTYYEFLVSAFTVAEEITHFGLPEEDIIQTDEDRKYNT